MEFFKNLSNGTVFECYNHTMIKLSSKYNDSIHTRYQRPNAFSLTVEHYCVVPGKARCIVIKSPEDFMEEY